jgi:DNA mismatch repair protein MutS2
LEIEKEKIEKGQRRLAIADEFLNEMIEKYNKLNQQLEQSRKEILHTAKAEAKQILDKSNQIIEKTIREIKESHADKEITKQLRQEITDYKEEMVKEDEPVKETKPETLNFKPETLKHEGTKARRHEDGKPETLKHESAKARRHEEAKPETEKIIIDTLSPIKVGDFVRLQETATIGKVVEIKNNQALIAFDSVSVRLEVSKLEKIKDYQPSTRHRPNFSSVINDLNERKAQFNTMLDLRGVRAEEALQITEKYMDEATLLSIKQLRILHGKGNGILRNLIRGLLAKNSLVEHFEDEFVETGGTGITLVMMK